MSPAIYNLRQFAPDHFQMAKFDADFNVAAIYNLTAKGPGFACDCPASHRTVKTKPCKHQRMMRVMMGAVNTNRFYDPESGRWSEPLAQEPAVIDQRAVEMTLESELVNASSSIGCNSPEPHLARMAAEVADFTANADGATKAMVQPPKPSPSSTPVVTRRI